MDKKNDLLKNLPYKLKKEKNIENIYEYLTKQSKKYKIFALLFLLLGLLQLIILLIDGGFENGSITDVRTIVMLLQVLLFPALGYHHYKESIKMTVTKDEICELL